MKIVFIRPFLSGELYEPPLGLATMVAYLKEKSNAEIIVWDLEVLQWTEDKLRQELQKIKPELVCISFMTHNRFEGLELAKLAKSEGAKVIIGGQHATAVDKEILQDFPFVDIVVRGEAEDTLLSIINNIRANKPIATIKGITFRNKNRDIIRNPEAELIDLNKLPMPAWDFFPMKDYKFYPVLGSRGCPYNCYFCGSPLFWRRKLRFREPSKVVDEIEFLLRTYGKRIIHIKDDVFTADRNWVLQICEEIKKRNLKFEWDCLTRVNLVDEELLKIMKNSGCRLIEYGVETGSDKLMVQINKEIAKSQVRTAVSIAKQIGIRVGTFFMLGHPGETIETLNETFNFAFELRGDQVTFTSVYIIPGTKLYDIAVQNKNLPEKFSWSQTEGSCSHRIPVYKNPGLPEEKISEYSRKFLMRFAFGRLFDIQDKSDYNYLFKHTDVLYHFSIYNFNDLKLFLSELKNGMKLFPKPLNLLKGMVYFPFFSMRLMKNHIGRAYIKFTKKVR